MSRSSLRTLLRLMKNIDLTEHGPPQHAWDQVAPEAAAHVEKTKHKAVNGCELSQKMVQGCSCSD